MQNEVEVNVLEGHSETDTPQLTREEVEQAVKKLQNGQAAGKDEIVAEMLKNGGEVMTSCWRYCKKCGERSTCQVSGQWQ